MTHETMESKKTIEQNPLVVEMKEEFVVRGKKTKRNRLTSEGKQMAKDTWTTVMDTIPTGEMSSETVAAKSNEFINALPKNEYTTLLKYSFEARVRNMRSQERLAEAKSSNSPWRAVVETASKTFLVGANGEEVVKNYLGNQIAEVTDAFAQALENRGVSSTSDLALEAEERLAQKTQSLLMKPQEKEVTEAGNNLARIVEIAAQREADLAPEATLTHGYEGILSLVNDEHVDVPLIVPNATQVQSAVQKSKRQLPEWVRNTSKRASQIGLAVVAAFTWQTATTPLAGSEVTYTPHKEPAHVIPPPERPTLPSQVTMHMNESYDSLKPSQELVQMPEWVPGMSEHKVGNIDLTQPFTMTHFENEKPVSVVITPLVQSGSNDFDSGVLETFDHAQKYPESRSQALVFNTDIQGVDSMVGHSSSMEINGKVVHFPFNWARSAKPGETMQFSQSGLTTTLRLEETRNIPTEQFPNSFNGWEEGPDVPDFLSFYAITGNENGRGFGMNSKTKEALREKGGILIEVCDKFDKTKGREDPARFKERNITAWVIQES